MTANFMLALMIGLLATVVILVVLGVIDSPRTPAPFDRDPNEPPLGATLPGREKWQCGNLKSAS